jgi:tetrahydromethanopterin S-methyltransferase subunit F
VLTRSRDTQMDKAKRTVNDVARYVQEVAQDERLRANVSSALAHGSKAGERLQKGIDAGGISHKLASDRKLRRNLRAMLDDLDEASDRVRRKQSHRLRNFLLMLAGVVGVAVALPKIRPLLAKRTDVFGTSDTEPEPIA